MAINGSTAGSIKRLKQTMKKRGGGDNFIKFISADGVTVRFLTEPDGWFGYQEHYDEGAKKFIPCQTPDCAYCDDGNRQTLRWLANAVDKEEGRVYPIKLPKSLAEELVDRWFEKYSTLLDRDYELSREGQGKNDTSYSATPEQPSKMRLDRFEPLDLQAVLQAQIDGAVDDDTDDDDDDDELVPPPIKTRPLPVRRAATPPPDDDDDAPPVRRPIKRAQPTKSAPKR